MLPEAKLDILLAHHASLEAQLLGQVNSENYVRITRELSELNPLIDAVKTYRAADAEIAGLRQLMDDFRCGNDGERQSERLKVCGQHEENHDDGSQQTRAETG